MDTRQIAALTNHHIISLLFLILSEVARRLGVPIVLTPGSDQTSDPEAGQAEVDQSAASGTGPICSYGCAVPGCHQWCRHNHTPHCRHRCLNSQLGIEWLWNTKVFRGRWNSSAAAVSASDYARR